MVQLMGHQLGSSLPTIEVSPNSFKDCLRAWLTVVRDQHLPAQIWVKLPSSGAWLEEFQQFCEAITPRSRVYLLTRQSLSLGDWGMSVPLPRNRPLRGEYGMLMVGPTLGAMVLAKRHYREDRSTPVPLNPDSPDEVSSSRSQVSLSTTVQPAALQGALDELRQWVRQSGAEHPDRSDLAELLTDWDQRFALPLTLDAGVVDALMGHIWQQQDQNRRQIKALRHKAMTATNLSTQNEALMNTLRIKDDFLNSVGQELRAPLTTIKTALPLLGNTTLKPSSRQRYLDMISRECDRQSTLINGVLDLLQIEMSVATITPGPVQLFDVVPGVVSTYQPLAEEKGVRLAYTISDTLPSVACPESWLRQIMIHLLHNSIKYTNSGGEVWVTAGKEGTDWVTLTVRDTGAGIALQEIPLVFKHFYRGRHPQAEEGAGLGLTIVQQLLLYCGGQIRVESQPGTGTLFRILLPTAMVEEAP
ncbi:ATP-binding protein [Leptolyngbya sp. PCC 6406]|uniref:ATP-binding protein n=1 Tax=Leptolyngbya sp. PCC 6406 TaxID=1173264 RepID=UPI0002ABE3EA|nr:ATP-binding protein [Leptolyngbya sp. PCC 6406]